ncbi:NAD-glutamate dehydrogenase domain-containing protein [Nocardia rhamnosiphila]
MATVPAEYKISTAPEEAVSDLARLRGIEPGSIGLNIDQAPYSSLRLRLHSRATAVTLSRIVPILHGMDLEVLDERVFAFPSAGGQPDWIYDIGMRVAPSAASAPSLSKTLSHKIVDTIDAIWSGRCEADGFNALVTRCELTFEQANIVRAYAAYLRQLTTPYTTATVRTVLLDNPQTTADLVRLFSARFDPAHPGDRQADILAIADSLARSIDAVTSLDSDRILRAFLSLIQATVRTNFFRAPHDELDSALAFKIDTARVAEAPHPRPAFEIFAYSSRVEGVHLRFGKIARGGLRWSDRRDDYRTEILDLAKAQTVKNTVIVPAGAKGGFVVKTDGTATSQAQGIDASTSYRTFIAALLSVTDNLDLDTRAVVPPANVVRHDDDDTYLVVAADKGTATFSDHANAVAHDRGFWLGDAFASGGSVGYDHKAMAITARGAWESVRQHFRELGHDVMAQPTTVVGIGDMSGDVFGNGMLLSPHLKLLAAFDHRHIFIDPTPDATASYAERARLFSLARSTWADYDPALLSAGGFLIARTAKRITLTPQARTALDLEAAITDLTPNELISAILRAPVDLLWNGGIGTYVKAAAETHSDVGDKTNDTVRVDGAALRARVVSEGGNLGLTQRGRIEYARTGGGINTDALDNSAGVDCSDREVNIKIVLDSAARAAILAPDQRADLLESMTGDVADLVLADNRNQNELMSVNRADAARSVALHARLVTYLQDNHGLDRGLANLPGSAAFRALESSQKGLTSPELAQLTAQVKLALKSESTGSSALRSNTYARRLISYFPACLTSAYAEQIERHPLRDDIITTTVVNEMVDTAGITFAFRLREETGAEGSDTVTAFVATTEIFGLRTVLEDIRVLEQKLPIAAGAELRTQTRRLIDRGARWLLTNRPQPIALDAQISRYQSRIHAAAPKIRTWLRREETAALDTRTAYLTELGAPKELASRVAELLHVFCLLDICDITDITGHDLDLDQVAELYFALSEELRINYYLTAVTALPSSKRWDSLARSALREELYATLRAVVLDVLAEHTETTEEITESVHRWSHANRARLTRALRLLSELPLLEHQTVDLPALSVAIRRIRSVIRTPEPQP